MLNNPVKAPDVDPAGTEIAAALSDLETVQSVRAGTAAYVFEGDSMTAEGGLLGAGESYPEYLMTMGNFAGSGDSYNVAAGAQPIATLITQYTAQVYPHRPAAEGVDTTYLFVWTFNNDYDSRDEAAIWADFVSYAETAKADGFTLVGFTIPKRRPPASNGLSTQKPEQEVHRLNLNERLRRYYGEGGIDILVDVDYLFPGLFGSNTAYDSDLSIDGTHFTALANRLLATHINAMWPGKGAPVRMTDSRGGIVVATEAVAVGSNAGTTSNATWNVRTLNSLDVDTDDLGRLVYRINYSFTPGAASGLVARQTITGGTSGAKAFVVSLAENTGAGTGSASLVNVTLGPFSVGETITASAFSGTVTTYVGTPDGRLYLAPGTYFAEASAIAIMSGATKLQLYNITNAAELIEGNCSAVSATDSGFTGGTAVLAGKFTITAGKEIQLRHWTTTGQSSYGKGLNVATGTLNRFAILKLTRLGK